MNAQVLLVLVTGDPAIRTSKVSTHVDVQRAVPDHVVPDHVFLGVTNGHGFWGSSSRKSGSPFKRLEKLHDLPFRFGLKTEGVREPTVKARFCQMQTRRSPCPAIDPRGHHPGLIRSPMVV